MEATGKKRIWFDRRLIIGLMLTIGVAASFWLGSRYPDLNEKSMIGAERDLQGIAFDVVFPVAPDDPVWKKIIFTTINWMDTNKKGMAFGLVFASCLLTILGFLDKNKTGGLFANTFRGFLIGAPMGLCVNCAAPVAYGLKKGGAKPETALGAMLSSPSMNVVVIGMMFSLLPWYLAALKLLFSFGLVFLFVPLLVRFSPKHWLESKTDVAEECEINTVCDLETNESRPVEWHKAIAWTAQNLVKNLWRLGRQTVPLMILAGFLGSTLITFMPFDLVKAANGMAEGGARIPMMFGLAIFGLFLPVPMAFDVVLVVMLMGLGIPISFAMILLLTLGSYSFYSYIIVAKAYSHYIAVIISAVVALTAVAAGFVAPKLQHADREVHRMLLEQHFKDSTPVERDIPEVPPPAPWSEIQGHLQREAREFATFGPFENQSTNGTNISIGVLPFKSKNEDTRDVPYFKRHEGKDKGIDLPSYFSIRKFVIYHHSIARGMSAGDVHGDNYPDVLICGDADVGGLYLFANIGGQGFMRQELDLGPMNKMGILTCALVDLSNDGWLDIVFTTLDHGNFIYLNSGGQFIPGNLHQISHKQGTSAVGISFHDVDQNGWLDMFIGNYAIGHVAQFFNVSHELSRNQLMLLDEKGPPGAKLRDLPGMPGETHGALFTDIDGDGHDDMLVYNDFLVADMLYLGNSKGDFKKVGSAEGTFPMVTFTTMSVQAADIDNDLDLELFFSENSKGEGIHGKFRTRITMKEFEETAPNEKERATRSMFRRKFRIFRNKNAVLTYYFIPEELRQDWMAYHILRLAAAEPAGDWLGITPDHRTDVKMYLNRMRTQVRPLVEGDHPDEFAQTHEHENILYFRQDDGSFTNMAPAMGLNYAGWTWNARFADLDHDEFQDLYIVCGWAAYDTRDDNTFFHNLGGKEFRLKTKEAGLQDYAATSAFNYIDFDQDGDLDIFTQPLAFAALRVFENQGAKGNSIVLQLRDQIGNRFGIGARIIIRYGEGKHQMREIRASGGFVSFDPQEAHFGLGKHEEISAIEIKWYDGERTHLNGPFPANRAYRISRSR